MIPYRHILLFAQGVAIYAIFKDSLPTALFALTLAVSMSALIHKDGQEEIEQRIKEAFSSSAL